MSGLHVSDDYNRRLVPGLFPFQTIPSFTFVPDILLVKTSSLGDVVHNLPVVSDIALHLGHARIDWVVEEAFAPVVWLHPAVRNVIPCTLRRWSRNLAQRDTWAGIGALRATLRSTSYDAIIDTQGLLKSALLTSLARGVSHGLDWRSSREPLRWFYDHVYAVPRDRHAVERNRALAGLVLGYTPEGPPRYSLTAPTTRAPSLALPATPAGFLVLLHATSADRKLWPEDRWRALAAQLRDRGCGCVLVWGNPIEQERAHRIAAGNDAAMVLPTLDLPALADVLSAARGVVGVDTGLTHLAAALGQPTVGIYVDTDPGATGVLASCAENVGSIGHPPEVADVMAALDRVDTWKAA